MKTGYVVCTRDEMRYLKEPLLGGFRLVSSIADATVYKTEEKALLKKERQFLIKPVMLTVMKISIS